MSIGFSVVMSNFFVIKNFFQFCGHISLYQKLRIEIVLGYAARPLLFPYDHFEAVFCMSFLQYAFKQPLLPSEVCQVFAGLFAVRQQAYVVHNLAELRFQLSVMSKVLVLTVSLGHREEVG